jgi:hypothetical protein
MHSNMTTTPILSVAIDTYNHERYVEQAIVSVLEQDFPPTDFEIVVVDDGSTDRTPEIVRKFAPRVRLLQKKNGGQASAFNVVIPETQAEIVSFLDGDDWFAPGKLTKVMHALADNEELSAVSHGRFHYHEGTGEVMPYAPQERKFLSLATPETAREAFHAWPFLVTSAVTVRKQLLNQILPIPEALTFCADGPIALASMAKGVCILEQPLTYYRLHSANLCAVVDLNDATRARRKLEMSELAFGMSISLASRLGVSPVVARSFICPSWLVEANRQSLATYGGRRLDALRTEMRCFRSDFGNPTMPYRLFKYLIVAPATLILPPRRFYKIRGWYGQRNLGRVRETFARSSSVDTRSRI